MQASYTLNIMNKLSPREKEVALYIAKVISTNDIAKKLNLSEIPERFILDNSFGKLKGNVKLGFINYSSSLESI